METLGPGGRTECRGFGIPECGTRAEIVVEWRAGRNGCEADVESVPHVKPASAFPLLSSHQVPYSLSPPSSLTGAVLTHANLIANAAGTSTMLTESTPGDRHLSYLPLAHIYERVNIVLVRS